MNTGVLVGGKDRKQVLEERLAKIKESSEEEGPDGPATTSTPYLCNLWPMEKAKPSEHPHDFWVDDKEDYLVVNAVPYMGALLQVDIRKEPFHAGSINFITELNQTRWSAHTMSEPDPGKQMCDGFIVGSAPFYAALFQSLAGHFLGAKVEGTILGNAKDLVKSAYTHGIITLTEIHRGADDHEGVIVHDIGTPYKKIHDGVALYGNTQLMDLAYRDDYCEKVFGISTESLDNITRWATGGTCHLWEEETKNHPRIHCTSAVAFSSNMTGYGIRHHPQNKELPALGVRARIITDLDGGQRP